MKKSVILMTLLSACVVPGVWAQNTVGSNIGQANSRNSVLVQTKVLRPKVKATAVPTHTFTARAAAPRKQVLQKPANNNPYNSRKQPLPTKKIIAPQS